jgi:hypothetical protein
VAALWFAGRASDLIRHLILAQLLAFALEPAVMWLHQRRGWSRGYATGLLLVGILLLFVVLGVGMGAVLTDQVDAQEGFKVGPAGLGEALAASGEERLGLAQALQVGGDGALGAVGARRCRSKERSSGLRAVRSMSQTMAQ